MLSACPDKVNTEIEAQHTACYIYQTETHHLQGVYRSFVQNAKFVNAASVPHIHFMASCVVEMFGLDMAASYQQAFTAIRQLAVLLRGALSMRTKDAFRQVYCWQTLKCLPSFWGMPCLCATGACSVSGARLGAVGCHAI